MRLDVYLTEYKFTATRSRSKSLIESNAVKVNGKVVNKASYEIDPSRTYDISVDNSALPYVSRGGIKLKAAIDTFKIEISGMRCIDIGASTGGFTDCMLRHGAKLVYAIDSGRNQLSECLKQESSVVSIEKFNARNMTLDTIDGQMCEFAAADLSFISQTYVLDTIGAVLCEGAVYIGLIKPQFECGREAVGKKGIVKGANNYRHAIYKVFDCAAKAGFNIINLAPSPIKGGDGNTEFLMHAEKCPAETTGKILISNSKIENVIASQVKNGRIR